MSRRVFAAVALALVATGASAQYVPRTFHDHAGTTKSDATDIEIDETTGLGLHKPGGSKIRLYLIPSPTPTPTLSATPTVTLSATPTVTQTPVPSPTPDTADQMSRSTAAGVTSYTALPDCDTSGLKCVYDQTTHAWSAVSESDPKVGTLTALKLCFSNAGGTAIDCTTTINAGTDVTADLEEEGQIGGVTVGGTPGDDKLPIGDSSSGATWRAIADCIAAGGVLQYSTAANASGLTCHTLVDADIPNSITIDAAAALTNGDKGDFTCTGGSCVLDASAVSGGSGGKIQDGTVDENDLAASLDLGGKQVELPNATACAATDCDAAGEVGRACVDNNGTEGQTLSICTDLAVSYCVGGTNDGATCANSSACPSGTCTRYTWRLPSLRMNTAPGLRCERIVPSADFAVSQPIGSNGSCTWAAGTGLMHVGDVIGAGQVPGNIQPTPITAHPAAGAAGGKFFGPNGEVTVGYSTQKYCWGGTNANATCSSDTACPGGVCQDGLQVDGKPARFDDGIALGVPLKVADASSALTNRTSAWCLDNGSTDLGTYSMAPRLWNRSQDRTIEKICWFSNVTGGSIAVRRDGSANLATPFPTPALPTPTTAATPGAWQADAGCLTGQAIAWPKDSAIAMSFTAGTGVTRTCIQLGWKLTP